MSGIRKMKRRVASYVQHMDRETMLSMGDRTFRRTWLRDRFGGWSQGLETYLQVSIARKLRRTP